MAGLPRDIVRWLQSLDLSYRVKNPRRDLKNGFIIAEIFSRRYSKEFTMHSFDNGVQMWRRENNWEHIRALWKKINFDFSQKDWEPVMHGAPGAALALLRKMYNFLTDKEHPEQTDNTPFYARPTASMRIRENEIQRVQDDKTRKLIIEKQLAQHKEHQRQLVTIPGRLAQTKPLYPQSSLRASQQPSRISQSMEQPIAEESEIREIKVKSMDKNIRAAKNMAMRKSADSLAKAEATKGKGGFDPNLSLVKPISEVLSEVIINVFTQAQFKDLSTREFRDLEPGEELTKAFFTDLETHNSGFVTAVFATMSKRSELIAEFLIKSAVEFRSYAQFIFTPLEHLEYGEKFEQFIQAMSDIAESLTDIDASTSKGLFEDFMLPRLVLIIKSFPEKRESVIKLLCSYSYTNGENRVKLLYTLRELLLDPGEYIKCLVFTVMDSRVYDDDLYGHYLTEAGLGLEHPSPYVRTAALSIFASIAELNPEYALEVVPSLRNMLNDNWWEVQAQILKVSGILLSQLKSEEHQESIEALRYVVGQVFTANARNNVLRIGLVYLAPALGPHPQFCDYYIQCLLTLPKEPRSIVLDTENLNQFDYLVMGNRSLKYRLGGVPELWDSHGIATSLANYVRQNNLDSLNDAHIDVLLACLLKKPNSPEWISVFDSLKDYLYVGLCDPEINYGSVLILRSFLTAENILKSTLQMSLDVLIKALKLLLDSEDEGGSHNWGYEFLKTLYWDHQIQELQEFVFQVIKEFAEMYPELFERTKLVELMNDIVSHRRGDIFMDETMGSGTGSNK